jgi:GTP1/Obg family GTP-binding protein
MSALSVAQQRQLGARFIAHVLDLTDDRRLHEIQETLAKPDLSAETLLDTYHRVHAIYVQTHPRSDLSEVDYTKQAVHFITEAYLICLSPTYSESKVHRIAEKAAMYCRMARTCANIQHDVDMPELNDTAKALQQEIEAQYATLSEFLQA